MLGLAIGFMECLSPAMAQETQSTAAPAGTGGLNANTGISSGSIIGNGSMHVDDTGVAVNGSVQDSNLNNNQNSNQNVIRPVITVPASSRGGSSALILPRNPLPMPNASLGRSNFGLQFGVQNNPGLASMTGGDNALGWFLQGGLTIPFGKIPDVYANPDRRRLDDLRRQKHEADRRVFGNVQPKPDAKRTVKGKVVGLNAYNYESIPSGKISVPDEPVLKVPDLPQPKVLALAPADVYTRPLNTGEKIGLVEVGNEYPYLGHTRSGWVKVMLPNGTQGWTSTQFEYIKYDFTEIDSLGIADTSENKQKASKGKESLSPKVPKT